MTCTLCGVESGRAEFCCAGCEAVYAILHAAGPLPPVPENAMPADVEMRDAVFHVSGMWCNSCAWLIEHSLAGLRGVQSARVIFTSDLLKVRYAPQYLPPERILERVAALGYRAAEYIGPEGRSEAERKNLLLRTGIAAFLTMNAMFFSLVIYASYFETITGPAARYIPFVLMALATPAVFYCAAPILRIAWSGARTRAIRMETLLSLGILSAYGYSAVQAFAGNLHVYFDTACAIVTLVLTGKLIERGAKDRTARSISLLYGLMPSKARLMLEGGERFVSVDALRPGTVFHVKPGERIPADGIVEEGRSFADESVLTGESAPRPKQPGDPVICGSVNTGSILAVRTTRAGASSTLAHMVRTVEQAAAHRTRTERAVDRVARLFVPAVLALAVLTFAGWTIATGRPSDALMHALAVVVIACPCALGIATPLALTAAVAAAGKHGILVTDTRVLETIRDIDTVVLDKTGTVTTGEFTLLDTAGDTSRMEELAAVEACSEHPIARALGKSRLRASDVEVHKGMGISGVVNGTRYFLGSRTFAGDGIAAAALPGGTRVYFGWADAVRGAMVFGDRIRPEAGALCSALRGRGIRTLLLSGDCAAVTEQTANAIGAGEWMAEAGPDRKIEIIRELQQKGAKVAMIGDGINDAPSLAQADLGIALGSGTDIAMQAAPLVLMNNSLAAVIDTLDLSRRTFRIVRQNLFWAFAYNSIGITLAIAGVLNPIMAAGAMVLSSLSVIGNSRRL
jgi:copper/silver-translocating P-type ATPase